MKRSISILACALVLIAGAAAAWADCSRIAFGKNSADEPVRHGHDHPHSDERQSHDSAVHCPTLDQFVPAASFSATGLIGVEHVSVPFFSSANPDVPSIRFFRTHGPPGHLKSFRIPPYLALSVLRV